MSSHVVGEQMLKDVGCNAVDSSYVHETVPVSSSRPVSNGMKTMRAPGKEQLGCCYTCHSWIQNIKAVELEILPIYLLKLIAVLDGFQGAAV